MQVLCIGSAVVDIHAHPIPEQELWQEKQRIASIQIMVGGDAANQSIRMAEMGVETALIAGIGNDQNGSFLRGALQEKQVDVSRLAVKPEYATGTALVLVDAVGERHTFSVASAHSALTFSDCAAALEESPKVLSLASLFSMPMLEDDGLLELLQLAKSKGVLTVADLASDKRNQGLDGIRRFLPYLDYFLPSLYDATAMTGTKTAEEASAVYHAAGARNIILKCGADGCYYSTEQGAGWIPAIAVAPIDTTGAGDTMVAFFLSRILHGDSVADACRYACAGASYSTLFHGASSQSICPQELEQWIQKNQK